MSESKRSRRPLFLFAVVFGFRRNETFAVARAEKPWQSLPALGTAWDCRAIVLHRIIRSIPSSGTRRADQVSFQTPGTGTG